MYGGYGGMGSYSSYGGPSSMGSYGSYGSTYGNSYSTLNRGMTQAAQGKKEEPEKEPRKAVFEQCFKMMGGLRSIIELGFACIAIANFYSHASDIVKKLTNFLKETGSKILGFLNRTVGKSIVSKFSQPETRMKTIKQLIINFIRVIAVLLLVLASKLRGEIKKQSEEKLQKLQKEYQQTRNGNIELVQGEEGGMIEEQEDPVVQNANL